MKVANHEAHPNQKANVAVVGDALVLSSLAMINLTIEFFYLQVNQFRSKLFVELEKEI